MNKFISLLAVVLLLFTDQLTANAAENQQLALKSEGAVLLDSDTGAVLYAKNAEEKMYPASLTKIATAIYAIEKGNLDSIVTVSANAVNQDGTRVYLNEGEQVPLKKLIQGMLINSGNDAAVAIAEYTDGTVEQFSEHLNEYLKTTIGAKNTHFANPNGLSDPNHYTTAMDLALMTNYAIKNPVFSEIFGTKKLEWEGQSWKTTLFTHHRMLKGELPYEGITGGKTGYTTEAKQTLATTADNGKIRLTAVVLKSEQKIDKYTDTALLYDYGFKDFQHATIKQGEIFKTENKEFYPENDTLFTENIDGCIKNLNSNGILSIENKNGQVIQSIQLKYNEPPKPKMAAKKMEQKPIEKESEQPLLQVNVIFGFMVIAFIGIFIGIRKKINRKF